MEDCTIQQKEDEEDRLMVVGNDQRQLEQFLAIIQINLRRSPTDDLKLPLQKGVKKSDTQALLWDKKLFSRAALGPRVVVSLVWQGDMLNAFYDNIGG